MPTLYMMRAEHTLGNHTPLHCDAVATIYRHRLVNAPRGGYMVDDDVLAPTAFYGIIVAIKPISNPDAKVTNDDLVSTNAQRASADADTVTGGSLSCYRDIWILDSDVRLKFYRPLHIKYHNTRPGACQCFSQAASTSIVQVCYMDYLSPTSSDSIFPVALGSGECQQSVSSFRSIG